VTLRRDAVFDWALPYFGAALFVFRDTSWLPFLDTYRTMCLAPQPDFRRVLEEVREMRLAA
jgi:hypothetical protein